ncbi:hypothetical protein XENTR_v10024728 [Xenopus tropicalis]|nr:hypothetical protein XENTR_v10024728 [Xenopus tropicalis]
MHFPHGLCPEATFFEHLEWSAPHFVFSFASVWPILYTKWVVGGCHEGTVGMGSLGPPDMPLQPPTKALTPLLVKPAQQSQPPHVIYLLHSPFTFSSLLRPKTRRSACVCGAPKGQSPLSFFPSVPPAQLCIRMSPRMPPSLNVLQMQNLGTTRVGRTLRNPVLKPALCTFCRIF